MNLLDGAVRPYAWGSRTALARLRGEPTPSPHPEAELWFGAHPANPTPLIGPDLAPTGRTLLAAISDRPEAELGTHCAREYDGTLPFLLKVLAADEPLSLQAHPSLAQAVEGFHRENAAGVPLDSAVRNYRDANHKPELVVAIDGFEALVGFRDPRETVALLRGLAVPALDPYLGMLVGQCDAQGLRAVFTTWITLPSPVLATLIPAVLDGCVRYIAGHGEYLDVARTVVELGDSYPQDPGVLAALLLNRVALAPGEGLYVAAGSLHAYLRGTAVEIMANSDNVLRGGLTPKHVDVAELLRVLDFGPVTAAGLAPRTRAVGAELVYETSAAEFRLSRIDLDATGLHRPSSIGLDLPGPQILLCTAGSAVVRSAAGETAIPCGRALWLSDSDPDVVVSAHAATTQLFRAIVPS